MGPAVSGIVLAGGAGRRMGADKALLRLGDHTLIEIVVGTLLGVTDDVVVASGASPRSGWPTLPVPLVADRVPMAGPVAGLDAGLRAVRSEAVIVVACDMPFLNPRLLRFLAEQLGGYDAVVPVCGGRRHPLHAVYSRRCLAVVEQVLSGRGSLHHILARVRTRAIPEHKLLEIDPGGLSCTNVNHPQEWERVQALWEARKHEAAAP